MENWKIATIAVLLLGLLGFGVAQQNADKQRATAGSANGATPTAVPVSDIYIGKTPPAWNFKNWKGAPLSLASLRGKPALVEIFRTECPHCQEAAPFLIALQKRYGPRGLKMVSIESPGDFKNLENPETDWNSVQSWVSERKITYPVAFDEGSKYFQGTIKKQILKGDNAKLLYPTVWLLDPNGKITWAQTGHDTAKAVSLALELERRFPTAHVDANSARTNGADTAKWLSGQLPELGTDKTMTHALGEDLGMRLYKSE